MARERLKKTAVNLGYAAWIAALLVMAVAAVRDRLPKQPPLPFEYTGSPIIVRSVVTQKTDTLLVRGREEAVAVVSVRCAICRAHGPEIMSALDSAGAKTRAILSVDDPEAARAYLRFLPPGTDVYVFQSERDREHLRVRFVPLFLVTSADGSVRGNVGLGAPR